jgi:hypothetical protein
VFNTIDGVANVGRVENELTQTLFITRFPGNFGDGRVSELNYASVVYFLVVKAGFNLGSQRLNMVLAQYERYELNSTLFISYLIITAGLDL